MSTPILAFVPASRNGHASAPALSAVTLGWLATSIDKLAELRAEKRRVEAAERSLTAEILATMSRHGLPALRAEHAIATVGTRVDLAVDPVLFVEAVGLPTAGPALRVSTEKARGVLGADILAAIAESTTVPTLRVDPIR
jgi:hypothetical protein